MAPAPTPPPDDGILASAVAHWVLGTHPGEPRLARRAALAAQRAYDDGCSVADAWARARALVRSWENHPSRAGHAEHRLPQLTA
ncbi:MAG: hypothetical protein ACYCU7_12890 [Acidimicrobiales bacterium]